MALLGGLGSEAWKPIAVVTETERVAGRLAAGNPPGERSEGRGDWTGRCSHPGVRLAVAGGGAPNEPWTREAPGRVGRDGREGEQTQTAVNAEE